MKPYSITFTLGYRMVIFMTLGPNQRLGQRHNTALLKESKADPCNRRDFICLSCGLQGQGCVFCPVGLGIFVFNNVICTPCSVISCWIIDYFQSIHKSLLRKTSSGTPHCHLLMPVSYQHPVYYDEVYK